VTVLERAAENDPGNPQTYETLGVVELRRDRPAVARRYLEKALALNDRLPISWNTLGVVLFRLEGPAPALAAWEKAVALDARQYDALFNIGLVAAQAGRRDQARRALQRFVASAPRERFGDDLAKARAMLKELGG
jgi:tetratricopeptide (TPR) repeat protein